MEQENFTLYPNFLLRMNAAQRELLRQAVKASNVNIPDWMKDRVEETKKESEV
jgi:hypothetical protein